MVGHFSNPAQDWGQLTGLLRPWSWLGIMTKLVISRERFVDWHYKNDLTHVVFYSSETFTWLGVQFGLSVERVDRDVLVLQNDKRPGAPNVSPITCAIKNKSNHV